MQRAQRAFGSIVSLAALTLFVSACPDESRFDLDVGTTRDAFTQDALSMDVNTVDTATLTDVNNVDFDALDGASGTDTRDDASSAGSDASVDADLDATLASSVDTPRDASSDAPSDVGTDAARIGFGPSQCSALASCPEGNFCTNRAPGGVCGCFPGTEMCPSGTSCDVDLGACIRDCTSDLDCVVGMACTRLTGRCSLRNCDAATPCPSPYLCATGRCFRPDCAAGEVCPAGWSCDGEYCVEP